MRVRTDFSSGATTLFLGLVCLASWTNAPPALAQDPVTLQHRTTFPESFGLLQSVRELADGRLLVADPLGGVLAAVDVVSERMDPVGREGGGPGEWRQPDGVFALPGDSTLLVDLGNARLSVLDPAGQFVRGYPMAMGLEEALARAGGEGRPPSLASMDIVQPRVTDAAGRIYYQSRGGIAAPGAAPDSSEVRRWSRDESPPATVARLRPPVLSSATSGGGGQVQVRMRPTPFAPQDDWAVAADGRIAVVRAEPYRVEWIGTDGRVTTGETVTYRPVRVGSEDRERWLENLTSGGLSVAMTVGGGGQSMQFRRGGGLGPAQGAGSTEDYEWPDVLPAFRAGGARVDPAGRVWVERYQGAGSPALYDVFDARGTLAAQVRLPADHRVIGFGRDAVYAVRVDDVGLNWLEVFAPPPRSIRR